MTKAGLSIDSEGPPQGNEGAGSDEQTDREERYDFARRKTFEAGSANAQRKACAGPGGADASFGSAGSSFSSFSSFSCFPKTR